MTGMSGAPSQQHEETRKKSEVPTDAMSEPWWEKHDDTMNGSDRHERKQTHRSKRTRPSSKSEQEEDGRRGRAPRNSTRQTTRHKRSHSGCGQSCPSNTAKLCLFSTKTWAGWLRRAQKALRPQQGGEHTRRVRDKRDTQWPTGEHYIPREYGLTSPRIRQLQRFGNQEPFKILRYYLADRPIGFHHIRASERDRGYRSVLLG